MDWWLRRSLPRQLSGLVSLSPPILVIRHESTTATGEAQMSTSLDPVASVLTRRTESETNSDSPSGVTGSSNPRTYRINLSLPPEQRYVNVARDYASHIHELTSLFTDVIAGSGFSVSWVRFICRLLLRRLASSEETAELRGISRAVGIEMYLLVAFNTFLDLFMGCSSGGVKAREDNFGPGEMKMLHFRTLDWTMDQLRKVIVQLEYVRDGEIIGTSITYVGFVGILTAVRKDLSISLNFRPNRDTSSKWSNIRYYSHLMMVLAGFKPALPSILRTTFFSNPEKSLADRAKQLTKTTSTVAYFTLSDGNQTIIIEKDFHSSKVTNSDTFIAVTNHDADYDKAEGPTPSRAESFRDLEFRAFVAESIERKEKLCRLHRKAMKGSKHGNGPKTKDVIKWMEKYPILNECTHFACVMDPREGKVVYLKRYIAILEPPD